jgi:chorismate dehydratase
VFGDQALAAEDAWDRKLVKADLGEWWRINTGLPMVFGLWGARKAWLSDNQESFKSISRSLREAKDRGLSTMLPQVVAEGVRRTGLPVDRVTRYFTRDLNYKMTDRHGKALAEYGKLCAKHGLFSAL